MRGDTLEVLSTIALQQKLWVASYPKKHLQLQNKKLKRNKKKKQQKGLLFFFGIMPYFALGSIVFFYFLFSSAFLFKVMCCKCFFVYLFPVAKYLLEWCKNIKVLILCFYFIWNDVIILCFYFKIVFAWLYHKMDLKSSHLILWLVSGNSKTILLY